MDTKTCTSHIPYNSSGLDTIASMPAIILSCANDYDGCSITARTPEDHANKIAGLLYRRFVDEDESLVLEWEMDYRLGHQNLVSVDYGNNYDETFFVVDRTPAANISDDKLISAINEHFRALKAQDSVSLYPLKMIADNLSRASFIVVDNTLCLQVMLHNPGPDKLQPLLMPIMTI